MIDFQDMIAIIDEMILNRIAPIWIVFFVIVWIVRREKNDLILYVNEIEIIWSDW